MKYKIQLIAALGSLLISGVANAENDNQWLASGLDKAQIRYDDITPHLEQIKSNTVFSTQVAGQSYQGRDIYRIDVGNGPVRILMWSQMHGDESTATPALFDLMKKIAEDSNWRNSWSDKISLSMIPMLNPDGAEMAQRQNAQGFDINRDARALQSPEGRILIAQAKAIKPHFGFNLHDQNPYYGAGDSGNPATISLLAPAYNVAKDISPERKRAMQVIGVLKDIGDQIIPGHMGRYDDTFSWRAFGDTLAEMSISTILIESGAYPGDPNRQMARKVNLQMLIAAMDSIASENWQAKTLEPYNSIPMNDSNLFKDIILSNISVKDSKHQYKLDIGINLDKNHQGEIHELGDLSTFNSFYQQDMNGWQYQPCQVYDNIKGMTLSDDDIKQWLKKDICLITDNQNVSFSGELMLNTASEQLTALRPQRRVPAAFLLVKGQQKLAVLSNTLIDVNTGKVVYQGKRL